MPSRAVTARSKTRPATLRAVAHAADVSVMTVSNVVNGRYDMMSADTRAKVEACIEKLGYRQHTSARGLRLARRFSVGMILADPSPSFLADPFITQVVAGLSNGLSSRGFSVALAAAPLDRVHETVLLRSHSTDGLCVMLSGARQQRARCVRRIAALGQPVVLVQESWDGNDTNVCSVRQDDAEGARELARRVLKQGARNVVMLVPSLAWPAIEARADAVRTAVERAADARLTFVTCGDETFVETQRALDEYVRRKGMPDAIIAANDQMGIAALKWLRVRGLEAPRDVLLTGYNAFDFWQYSEPLLTTVRSPAYELGDTAGRAMLAYLDQGRFGARDTVLPVSLVAGDTA
jgi:LacI family transcriptional regulator